MEDIIKLIRVFENRVISQWVYDTKLDNQESYITSAQIKKCDALAAETEKARQDLITAIENL